MEKSLKESEEKFRDLFENASDLIQGVGIDGKFTYVNKKWKTVLGYSDKEVKKLKFTDVIRKDQIPHCMIIFKKLIKGQSFENVETVFITKDGKEIYVEGNVNAQFRDGKFITTRGIFRDISERKKSEEELQKVEEKWISLTRNTDDIIIIVDRKCIIQYINKTLGNYTPEKTVGKLIYNYVPKEQHDVMRNSLKNVFKTEKPDDYEVSSVISNLGTIWFSTKVVPIKHDGKIVSAIMISTDITERKKVEKALKYSEEKYRNLFENAVDPIMILDNSGRFIEINKKAEELFGYKKEELIGKKFMEASILAKTSIPIAAENFKKRMNGIDIQPYELEFVKKDGQIIFGEVNAASIKDDDKINSDMVIIRDISERKKVEEKINLLSNAVEESNDGILMIDLNGKITYANDSVLKIFGYTNKEFLKLTVDKLNQNPEQAKKILEEIKKKGKWIGETVGIRKDKTIFLVALSVSIVRDKKGNVIGIMNTMEDITEQKKVEKEIRTSEDRYRKLFEENNDAIFIANPKTRMLVDCNKKAEKLTGYSRQEILSMHADQLHPKDKVEETMKGFKDQTSGLIDNVETEILTKNGRRIHVSINSSAIEIGGNPCLMGVFRDITEHKQVEEKIIAERNKIRIYLDSIVDGITVTDKNANIVEVNKSHVEMLGYKSSSDIIGKPFINFIAEKEIPKLYKMFTETIKNKEIFIKDFEVIIKRKDGSEFPVMVNMRILWNEGEYVGCISVIRDITETKKTEDEIKRSRNELVKAYDELKTLDTMKADFMNVAAHELKTPLIPIVGYLDLLLKGDLGKINDNQMESLKTVQRNITRLQRLIQDILDITKLESKVMKFDMKDVKIDDLIIESVNGMKPLAEKNNLKLVTDIQTSLPVIYGDAQRLMQVVGNLIDNAIKFTDAGTITVEAKKMEGHIQVSVKDTGIGIGKDFMSKLFKKFQQADTSVKRKSGGTGLGLAICKEIIDFHNGKIWAESEVGKGSNFIFILPIKRR